jgi:hypothetical protein
MVHRRQDQMIAWLDGLTDIRYQFITSSDNTNYHLLVIEKP